MAQAAGLQVIADAAQSFGAVQGDGEEARPVGSLAPMTTVSFYPSKPLGCFGDGGGDPDRRSHPGGALPGVCADMASMPRAKPGRWA